MQDATDLEDAEIFFGELERLEEAGELEDFALLAESLGKLYAEPDVEAGPEAVEIMTIHKAKGLEFGTVIVPGLDRPPRSGMKPLFAWRSLPGGGLLIAPIDETGGEKEPLYQYVRQLDREAEDIEAGRLFYVAATRAESRLHLLGCVKVDEDGVVKMPSRRSLLGLAWAALGERVRLPAAVAKESEVKESLLTGELRRLPSDSEMPEKPMAVEWKAVEEGREEEQIEFSWVGETARHVGTVVHRWLQRMAEDELKGWTKERVETLAPQFASELQRRGVQPSDIKIAARLVATALANAITDERGRWILGPHGDSHSEYRISTSDARLIVDRTFCDEQGTRWIVDYKLSVHEGSGLSDFLDEERRRYGAQLAAYAKASPDSRTGIYFPLLKGWR